MSTIPTRALRTGVELSTLGFGGAPLGELFDPVSETQAQDTLQAAWDAGIRYYGVPAGHELESVVDGIEIAAGEGPELTDESLAALATLDRSVRIQVFVTPT